MEGGAPDASRSYATVAESESFRVRIARGQSLEIPKTTDFFILPNEDNLAKYGTSKDTKEALIKAVRFLHLISTSESRE